MYAMHDALRGESEHIARITARAAGAPPTVLRTAAGWHMFPGSLHVHPPPADDALWPVLREPLAQRPYDLALLEAMEAEHTAIEAIIGAIDSALAEPGAAEDHL